MNQHPAYVGQYPPPQQQQYQYATGPYPPQQTQPPPYQFDPRAIAHAQAQAHHQQQLFNRSYQSTPVPQQPVHSHQQTISRPQSGHQQLRPLQPPTNDGGPSNGPGAPGPEPTSPDDEDELEDEDDDQDQTQADDSQPIYKLPPPPESTYASEPDLEQAMHAWSLEHGYELVRRASKKNAKGVLYKRYYHCSKHGQRLNTSKLPPGAPRQRVNRKSARTGCPMSIACVSVDPNHPQGEWQIRHRKTHHNHPPLKAIALAGHRRRARMGGIEQAVDELFAAGSSTVQVLQFLQKTHKDGLYTRTDVANMKTKWKKWGTCADRQGKERTARDVAVRSGVTDTCTACRERRSWCNAVRPQCQLCIEKGSTCVYVTENPQHDLMQLDDGDQTRVDLGATDKLQTERQHSSQPPLPQQQGQNQQQALPAWTHVRTNPVQATQQIHANLQNMQQEPVTPTKLNLQSSSVEMLANSSCGTGESFKSVPVLFDDKDWSTWRDAMISAARKENTNEVLLGDKTEPVSPGNGVDARVEEWNEYIRQQAIYNRRNAVQLSGIYDRLSPSFRNRVRGATKAADAWSNLEEYCQPRGSQQAFKLYLDLHSITLESCQHNLQDYISAVTSTYQQFSLLKLNRSPPILNRRPENMSSVKTGGEAVPEEMICFLFLKGLGEGWSKWADGLVATNNIGGFGTGERLGLKELGKRALGYQAMQRVGDGGR